MKKLTNKLYELHMTGDALEYTEAPKHCFNEIMINLHELINLGFTPDEIEIVLDSALDDNLDKLVLDTILLNK